MNKRTALREGFIVTADSKRVCSGAEEPLGALCQLVPLRTVPWGGLRAITTAAGITQGWKMNQGSRKPSATLLPPCPQRQGPGCPLGTAQEEGTIPKVSF